MESRLNDVAIVGGGAAGLSAALVLGRARRRVVVIDAGAPRNAPAEHMQGFLSRDGMPPSELLRIARDEVRGYGVEIVEDFVIDAGPEFVLRLGSGRTIEARHVLLATGAVDQLPDIDGARERWGRDFLHCPYCHGWEVRDQPLGVLGTGPGSVDHAQLLRQWSEDVTLFSHVLELSEDERSALAARGVAIVDGVVKRFVIVDDACKRLSSRTVARSRAPRSSSGRPCDHTRAASQPRSDASFWRTDFSGSTPPGRRAFPESGQRATLRTRKHRSSAPPVKGPPSQSRSTPLSSTKTSPPKSSGWPLARHDTDRNGGFK
jgi:hypothetical protein